MTGIGAGKRCSPGRKRMRISQIISALLHSHANIFSSQSPPNFVHHFPDDVMSHGSSKHVDLVLPPGKDSLATEVSVPVPSERAVPTATSQPIAEDAFGALKSIAEVGGLFLALSFVGGWSFMASYYLRFGLNPSELDFSVPATSAFAIHMLRSSGWPLVLAAALLISLTFFYESLGSARRAWAGACIVILMFVVATAGSLRGRVLAAEDMFDTSPRLPSVGFISKGAAQEPNCLAKGTTDCKLLLHAKGAYYFFEPIPGEASQAAHGRNIRLYIVPESEVSSTQLVRGVE